MCCILNVIGIMKKFTPKSCYQGNGAHKEGPCAFWGGHAVSNGGHGASDYGQSASDYGQSAPEGGQDTTEGYGTHEG